MITLGDLKNIVVGNFFFKSPVKLHSLSEEESKYKASSAGGGDSSNHTTSSSTTFAYLASEWATELALRRIQLKTT